MFDQNQFYFSVYYSPFFAHIFEGWAKRNHPNVLFLFYEDRKKVELQLQCILMKLIHLKCVWIKIKNLRDEIDKVCTFLGKTLSEEQLQSLLKHLHFDNFSKNEAVNFVLIIPSCTHNLNLTVLYICLRQKKWCFY